jgi:hypothetical protein
MPSSGTLIALYYLVHLLSASVVPNALRLWPVAPGTVPAAHHAGTRRLLCTISSQQRLVLQDQDTI